MLRSRIALSLLLVALPVQAGDRTWDLIDALSYDDARSRARAERTLIELDDPAVAAPLVELLFFSRNARPHANRVLEKIFDRSVEMQKGNTYKGWFEVLGAERTEPIGGYIEFKAEQYSRIDPAFAELLSGDLPRTIRVEEVIWGGVRKDGIPALRNPEVIGAEQASYLRDDDVVFGIVIEGEARAYPRRILASHEMANDVLGGKTISLAYCTLCGAAVPYGTTLGEGETYTFGTSGLLYRSNKLMYDHQTNTLWSQITGEPVWGRLVGKGKSLPILPVTVTTWAEWRNDHPATTVLSLETGFDRDYSGETYARYFASPDLMFPVWKKDSRLEPKDEVLVARIEGSLRAWPVELLSRKRLLFDVAGEQMLVVLTDPAGGSRVFARTRTADDGEDGLPELEDPTVSEDFLILDEKRYGRVPSHVAYWFGVSAQYPDIELYEE